jgi:DNA-binding response OmpR family regulator
VRSVLVVEDDAIIGMVLEECLSDNGYEVCGIAGTASEALAIAERTKPDLAIVDVRLRKGNGIEVARKLEHEYSTAVLFATGNREEVLKQNSVGLACLAKPFQPSWVSKALKLVEQIATGKKPNGIVPPPYLRLIERTAD